VLEQAGWIIGAGGHERARRRCWGELPPGGAAGGCRRSVSHFGHVGRIGGGRAVAAVAVFAGAAFGLLDVGWRSPHRGGLAAGGVFAAAVVRLVVGGFAWAWRAGASPPEPPAAVTRYNVAMIYRAGGEFGWAVAEPGRVVELDRPVGRPGLRSGTGMLRRVRQELAGSGPGGGSR
jgi:hypothetical protein